MHKVILQIAGEARSGKSGVSKHLADEFGFSTILISDIIRDYSKTRGVALGPRSDYLKAHASMKAELGVSVVADMVLKTEGSRLCVDGIRVLNDVQRLRAVGSKVIALNCPAEIRFERARKLQTTIDPMNLEQFLEDDERDGHNPDPERQNTQAVMDGADYHIDSSRTLSRVFEEVDSIVIPLLG